MSDHRREILDMLANGQITADEAERLLAALDAAPSGEETRTRPRYIRVQVEGTDPRHDGRPMKVNVRAPMQLLRAGVRLASLLPANARSHVNEALLRHGIRPENLEEILEQLGETTVDVNDNVKVRLFCE